MVTGVGPDRMYPSRGMNLILTLLAVSIVIRWIGGTSQADAILSHSDWSGFREGFLEVSGDLDGWHADVKELTRGEIQIMIARNISLWATDEELVQVYRARSDFFSEIAGDPSRNRVCAFEGLWDDRVRYRGRLPETLTPFLRVAGRSMARMHEGKEPWPYAQDPAYYEAAFLDFEDHLDAQGLGHVVDLLMADEEDEGDIDREAECYAQVALYQEAAENPDLPIGPGSLLDFVRNLEVLATQEG